MEEIIKIMLSSFETAKESGSYFLFYLLALGLGLAISWDRYSKSESHDNWMLEEAKQKIALWPFLYGLISLLLVAANPLAIWILNRLTPMENQYTKVWSLLLLLFISAYGVVCFLSLLREERQKVILLVGFILVIGLSGSFYGLMSPQTNQPSGNEEQQVIEYLQENKLQEEIRLMASDPVVEYVGYYAPEIKLIYGKDLYTANLDLGIMDLYDSGLLGVYQAINDPVNSLEQIAESGILYDCNVIILKEFGKEPETIGKYQLKKKIGSYLIYMR